MRCIQRVKEYSKKPPEQEEYLQQNGHPMAKDLIIVTVFCLAIHGFKYPLLG